MERNEAVKIMADAFVTFEQAKEDCKDVVDSTIEAYADANKSDVTGIELKEMKKVAKAIATAKIADMKQSADMFIEIANEQQ